MRRFLIAFSVLLVLAICAIVVGPALLPQASINGLVAGVVERALGYPVTITGSSELTILPKFRLKARGVSARINNDGGKDAPALFDLGGVHVEIDTLSLLYNRVRVDLVRFENPVVRFHMDSDGRKNWQRRQSAAERREALTPDRDWGWWNEFDLVKIETINGRMLFVDRARRWRLEAENIDLASSKPVNTTSGPGFALSGSARVNGENMAVRVETGAISKALAGGRFPVVFGLDGPTMTLRYQGSAAKRQVVVSDGTLTLRAADFGRFRQWLGSGTARANDDGSFAATTRIDLSGDRITFSNIDLEWPDGSGKGEITASQKSDGTLALDGDLKIDTLDVSTLGGEAALAGAATLLPDNLTGKVTLTWQQFRRGGWQAGPGRALLHFTPGPERWSLDARTDHIYGGRGRAYIRWGLAEGMASLKAEFQLMRVEMADLLAGVSGNRPLSGQAHIELDLFSVGGTVPELIAALGGNGRFNVVRGGLEDPDLARHLSGKSQPLQFSQLLGSFTVGQGIARTQDLLLRTPEMSMVGSGHLDLADAYVNIDLRSVSKKKAAGTTRSVKPLRIEGPISALAAGSQ